MINLLWIFLVFAFCVGYFLWTWLVEPFRSPLRKIPGPPWTNLVFGHLLILLRKNAKNPFEPFEKWNQQYGGLVRYMFFFGRPRLAVTDPEIFKYIHVTNAKNYRKPPLIGFKWAEIIVGRSGLVFSNGDLHRKHRRIINPVFTMTNLKKLIPVLENRTERLANFWRNEINLQKNDDGFAELWIRNDVCRMTLDAIGKAAFDFDFQCIEKETELSKKCLELVSSEAKHGFKKLLHFLPLFHYFPTKENANFWATYKWFCQTIDDIIVKKQKTSTNVDILDMILSARDPESGENLSSRELREECMTFLLAGHETTSLGLSWTLLELAQNEEIQNKCREEIREKMPLDNFELDDLHKLTYLECCIKESLRLHAPVPAGIRQNIEDDYVGGYFIPAGTIFLLLQGVTHVSSEYWPEPRKFDPERFLNESKFIPFSYLPFVAGPRMCIGYKFALMELKIALALILRTFEFRPHPTLDYGVHMLITQSPDPSLRLMVKNLH